MTKKYLKFEDSHRVKDGVKQKRCSHCRRWKSLNLFCRCAAARDKRHWHCKKCAYQYANKTLQKAKDEIFAHYGGYQCVRCKNTDKEVLTLDHVDDDGAKLRRLQSGRQSGGSGYYRYARRCGYPDKLQVLCCNCQAKKEIQRRKKDTKRRRQKL